MEGFAKTGDVFTYDKHGFEATNYVLTTDQLGTQLDPPAHWAPENTANTLRSLNVLDRAYQGCARRSRLLGYVFDAGQHR